MRGRNQSQPAENGSEHPSVASVSLPLPGASPQTDVPFAVVQGEPFVSLPRDLYIPPDALEVFLDAFEGPLDLLLYLIRRQNLNVLDIPIAEITRQYMEYIGLMREMRLELAAEYLVMAAMLAEIKSRMLLPRPQFDEGEEEDPRAELARRLQEYERYKAAAEDMDSLPRIGRDVYAGAADLGDRAVAQRIPELTMREMLLAFKDVLHRAEMFSHHHVQREQFSVRQRMSDVLIGLQRHEFREFSSLFTPEEGRRGAVVTFLAILELIKQALIDLVQTEPFGPVHVRASGISQVDLSQVRIEGEGE